MGETFKKEVQQDQTMVRLLPILDMSATEEFLEVMRDCVAANKNVLLDGADVQRISTPFVQVMLATSIALAQTDLCLKIKNVSSDFDRGLRDLGFSEYLGNWSEI